MFDSGHSFDSVFTGVYLVYDELAGVPGGQSLHVLFCSSKGKLYTVDLRWWTLREEHSGLKMFSEEKLTSPQVTIYGCCLEGFYYLFCNKPKLDSIPC